MRKFFNKIRIWWLLHVENPVIRKGQSPDGAFRWKFRRFWLEISTLSGNFKARYMADEHPYAYLLAGKTDDNIIGFCQFVYMLGKTLTTDKGFANDVKRAFDKYDKRLIKRADISENETEEKIALEQERRVQEFVEMPKRERRKEERRINKNLKKASHEEKGSKEER